MQFQNGVVVRDVRADKENDIGLGKILVASDRAVRTEGLLVAHDSGSHTERGVPVVVVGLEPELYELAQRVELFCQKLSRRDDGNCALAVFLLYAFEFVTDLCECLIPA